MNKFLIKSASFLLLYIILQSALFSSYTVGPERYVTAYRGKKARIQAVPSPKLVLLGDSNLAFGIHSPLIEETFEIPVVNTGLIGTIGLKFSLDLYADDLVKGDIVLIIPSYGLFGSHLYGKEGHIAFLIRAFPETFQHLRSYHQMKQFILGVTRGAWSFLLHREKLLTLTDDHSPKDFEEHGDFVGHYGLASRYEEKDHIESNLWESFIPSRQKDAISILNAFAEEQAKKGVKVFLSFSPYPRGVFLKHFRAIDAFYKVLHSSLKFPILGTPKEFIFPDRDFFDTSSHLSGEAGVVRTRRLSSLLAEALKETELHPEK